MDAFTHAASLFEPAPPLPYVNNINGWVTDRLGEHLWSKQQLVATALQEHRRVAVQSCHGVGKALALDTPIPTPSGWVTIGDIREGAELYDEHGTICRVVAKSPIWADRDCYRVDFDDGTHIIASGEHEWAVLDLAHRPRHVGDWRDQWHHTTIRTTAHLAAEPTTTGGQRRWRIPLTRPLTGTPTRLPAYTLGVWLGDGVTTDAAITLNHWDAPTILAGITAEKVTYRERPSAARDTTTCYGLIHGFKATLRDLGMLGHKHIPPALLRADHNTRAALLQGLMDTDGYKCTGASASITTMLPDLADDIAELIRSLGGKPFLTTKQARIGNVGYGTAYIINFRPTWETFRLDRQLDTFRTTRTQQSRHTIRTITAITPVATVPTQCIEVDSPSHLFLAGPGMIPTHNSFLASRVIAWWLDQHPPGEAFVVSTAPTFAQVRAVLWREVGKAHRKAGLPGRVNQTEWLINDELVAFGRKPSDTDPTAFQGIHARHVLVILDEACGIPKDLWIAAGALITNDGCRMLAIGNPDDPGSYFADVCADDSGWHTITISAFDSPNFTGEPIPDKLRDLLVSPTWVDDMRHDVGEGSGPWTAKVLGQFPTDSDWQVVPTTAVTRCRAAEQPAGDDRTVELGMDVGAGGDQTVVYERVGRKAGRVWRASTPEPSQAVELAMLAIRETGATSIKVDSIGVGWGIAGRLQELRDQHGAHVVRVNVGSSAKDTKRFPKLRDELWWMARTLSEHQDWDLSAVDDRTISQLTAPQYGTDPQGRIKIEPKAETKKRLGRSPDDADALLLAFHQAGSAAVWMRAWRDATTPEPEPEPTPERDPLRRSFADATRAT